MIQEELFEWVIDPLTKKKVKVTRKSPPRLRKWCGCGCICPCSCDCCKSGCCLR